MGDFLVSLQPPVVTNLFSLLRVLCRRWGRGVEEVYGEFLKQILNAPVVISVFLNPPGL